MHVRNFSQYYSILKKFVLLLPCSQYQTTQWSLKPIGYCDRLCPSKSGSLYLVSVHFGKFLSLLSSYHHRYLLIYSSTICFHVLYNMFPLIYICQWGGMERKWVTVSTNCCLWRVYPTHLEVCVNSSTFICSCLNPSPKKQCYKGDNQLLWVSCCLALDGLLQTFDHLGCQFMFVNFMKYKCTHDFL